jgi:membrane-bound serine protease (ClpP class)
MLGSLLEPLAAHASPAAQGQPGSGFVYVAPFKLPITPISANYYERLVRTAEADGANALVIQLDTPGGLVDSMNVIVQRTLGSRVPVIIYVSPPGAMAASAGVFMVYSGHVAAMAPNTTIGSAEVIFQSDGAGDDSDSGSGNDEAMRRKATNELVARIRSLAAHRGRNADFGEKAVRESANLHAEEAAAQKVVDFVARDLDDLLNKADGRQVDVNGQKLTVKTRGATVRSLDLNFAEQVLLLITNPNVAFLLISLGTLGITWEFINPGSVFPGVVGALMLLVGLLGLGTLPINLAGLVFLVFAFVLFIADIFAPTHGILTAGGIISLIIGGLLLVNTPGLPDELRVSPYVVMGTAVGLGSFFFLAVYKVYRARRARPTIGRESLVGKTAETRTDLAPEGMVFVDGELWHAVSTDGHVPSGQRVQVVATEGLRLKVRPLFTESEGAETRKL